MGGRALPLVTRDASTGLFGVSPDASAALRALSGPVAAVVVCGRARQGKSFLLNCLLREWSSSSPGADFEVGPTTRPCTKGLWLWSEPVPMPGGWHLLLVDVEGVDAYDQTSQYAAQLLCISLLGASVMVWNQMGGIDEGATERLGFCAELAAAIRERAGGTPGSAPPPPSLLWLLRDFYLGLEGEEGPAGEEAYVRAALAPLDEGGDGAAAGRNAVRASIRATFGSVACATLPRPADDEEVLRDLGTAGRGALRPKFVAGVAALAERVAGMAAPRDGWEQHTGAGLAAVLSAVCTALNEGKTPRMGTLWEGVVKEENAAAAEEAAEAYTAAALAAREAAGGGTTCAALDAELQAGMAAAEAAFSLRALGSGEQRGRAWAEASAALRHAHSARAKAATAAAAGEAAAAGVRLLEELRAAGCGVEELAAEGARLASRAGDLDLPEADRLRAEAAVLRHALASAPAASKSEMNEQASLLAGLWRDAAESHAGATYLGLVGELVTRVARVGAGGKAAEEAEEAGPASGAGTPRRIFGLDEASSPRAAMRMAQEEWERLLAPPEAAVPTPAAAA